MDSDHNAPPLNPVPWIVWLFFLPLVGAELAIQLQAQGLFVPMREMGLRQELFQTLSLRPEILRLQWETGGYPADQLYRLVSYPFVHAGFSDTLFAAVLFLALGKKVGEAFAPLGFAVIVLASTMAGALAYGFLVPEQRSALIGAYPTVYGLIGALTYLLYTDLDQSGGNRLWAFRLIGFLLGAQLIFAAIFGTNWTWIAELAGFATGFAFSFAASPDGFQRLRNWLRQR